MPALAPPPEVNISTNGGGIVSLIYLDLPCTLLLEPGVGERVEVKLLQSRMEEVVSLEPAVVVVVAVAVAVAAAVLVIVAGPVQRLESGLPPLKEMGATSQCNKSSTQISHFFVSFFTGLCVVSHRHQHLKRIYACVCVDQEGMGKGRNRRVGHQDIRPQRGLARLVFAAVVAPRNSPP